MRLAGARHTRATYTAHTEDGAIVVEDLDRGRSVTNDAEAVVEDLREAGFDLTLPVIYRDSQRLWDALEVREGRFAGFRILHAATLAEARARLAAHAAPPGPSGP